MLSPHAAIICLIPQNLSTKPGGLQSMSDNTCRIVLNLACDIHRPREIGTPLNVLIG